MLNNVTKSPLQPFFHLLQYRWIFIVPGHSRRAGLIIKCVEKSRSGEKNN
jgi:predicted DNA-binding protein (MmcQ/YjbR family)